MTRSACRCWSSSWFVGEVVLSKGQEWDWLGDHLARPDARHFILGGLGCIIFWGCATHVVNFRALGERTLAGLPTSSDPRYALFAGTKSLLGLLETLFGYDALKTGVGDVACRNLCRPGDADRRPPDWPQDGCAMADRRGLLLMTAGNYWMSQLNLDISRAASCCASGAPGHGVGMFCSCERSRLPHTPLALRGRSSAHRVATQRGGQRRGVLVPDLPRAARSVSRPAAWGVS